MKLSDQPVRSPPEPSSEEVRRARILSSMAASDIGSMREIVSRYVIIAVASFALFFATNDKTVIWWLATYLIVSYVYSYNLWHARPPISRQRLSVFIAGNIVVSTIYAAMPLYLWTWDEPAVRTIGLCGIIGFAVHNISRQTERSPTAIWDSVSVLACIAFMGGYEIVIHQLNLASRAVIGVGALAVSVFYLSAQWAVIRAREQLTRALEANAQAGKMKAVGQLTSGISHDFNNLLTVIRGNIELAEITPDDHERADLLAQAREASDRAAKLTAQLLAFSRKARLQTEDVDVAPFVSILRGTLSRVLPASIEVTITASPELKVIHCDPTLLESALLNLSINARDAMEGRGKLDITFAPDPDEPVVCARIDVCDNGPGIPDELIEMVTEPFFTTKKVGEGSGLGLSMVSGFAAQSGGRMSLASSPAGTCISLLLPISQPVGAGSRVR